MLCNRAQGPLLIKCLPRNGRGIQMSPKLKKKNKKGNDMDCWILLKNEWGNIPLNRLVKNIYTTVSSPSLYSWRLSLCTWALGFTSPGWRGRASRSTCASPTVCSAPENTTYRVSHIPCPIETCKLLQLIGKRIIRHPLCPYRETHFYQIDNIAK